MKPLQRFLRLVTLFCFAFGTPLYGQNEQNIEHIIQSDAFDTERKIHVFLPARYFRDTTEQFTVTYVLDAHYDQLWNMAKSNSDYLVDSRSVFPMIVVGIQSENRGREFTPPALPLKAHFEKEVFPLIEKQYRVNKFRTVVGHSWGGAFIGCTLFSKDKDLFDAYVSISPSMAYRKRWIFQQADSMLTAKTDFRKFLYCSSGDVGDREMMFGGQVADLDSMLKHHKNPSLAFKKSMFEGTDHWSCVIPSLNVGLVQMSRNYWADQKVLEDFAQQKDKNIKEQVAIFNKNQQKNFGYNYHSNVRYLSFVAEDFTEMGNYQAALDLNNWIMEMEPESWRTEMSIAYIHSLQKDFKTAVKHYKLSLAYLEKHKDKENEKRYNSMKKNLLEKIETYSK